VRQEVVQMKRDELKKAAREAVEKLIQDVEAGISETLRQYLKAMGRFHRYSVGDAILIGLQKPDAHTWQVSGHGSSLKACEEGRTASRCGAGCGGKPQDGR
jgi:hypothetical protein